MNFAFLAKFDAAGANLLYGTLLGPTTKAQSTTTGYAVAVDAAGFAYIGGSTYTNLYTTTGAYQTVAANANGARAFAAKFDTVGKKIVYSTYLTGTDSASNVGEAVTGIAADASGNAYVAGYTAECSFPTTTGVFEPQASYPAGTSTSCGAGFITKLNATGSALVWSTFLGNAPAGNGLNSGGNASINGLTLGTDGSVYVTGQTNGGGFPSVNPIFGVSNNLGFVSRVSADGTKLLFSTPFGGSTGNSDIPSGIAVDPSGNIYFAGQTNGNSLPVTAGAFQSAHAGGNNGNYYTTGFVGKIAPTATTTTALTLPTGTITAGQSVKLSAKVTGQTGSTGTPTGTVTFLSGSTTLGTGTLDSTATAIYTAPSLNATTYSITANYAGDTAFTGSVSSAQNLVVAPLTPTVTLTVPSTAVVGASVTLSVAVAGAPGTPTGTITFKDGTTTLSTAALASGSATYSTSALAVGTHSITVSYSGDSIFGGATSAASTVTINLAPAINFAAQPTSLTVVHGSSGSIVITGTPVGGYTGTVTFACGTLPGRRVLHLRSSKPDLQRKQHASGRHSDVQYGHIRCRIGTAERARNNERSVCSATPSAVHLSPEKKDNARRHRIGSTGLCLAGGPGRMRQQSEEPNHRHHGSRNLHGSCVHNRWPSSVNTECVCDSAVTAAEWNGRGGGIRTPGPLLPRQIHVSSLLLLDSIELASHSESIEIVVL